MSATNDPRPHLSRGGRPSSNFGPLIGLAVVFGLIAAFLVLRAVLPSHWEPSGPGPRLWHGVSEEVSESEHCGWQGIPFLYVRDGDGKISLMYARDVDGVVHTAQPFEAHATLPPDAVFTGWRDGNRELWTDAPTTSISDGASSIYIVSPSGVERWGQAGGCV